MPRFAVRVHPSLQPDSSSPKVHHVLRRHRACAATPATLLIHGVGDASNRLKGGCDGTTTWYDTLSFLKSHGWTNVYSLGYYSGNYDCGPTPSTSSNPPTTDPEGNLYYFEKNYQFCSSYPNSDRSRDGTWNEDDKPVACELAWYIFEYYTVYGNYVNIVAHSLGGVLPLQGGDRARDTRGDWASWMGQLSVDAPLSRWTGCVF
jgi:hypothetical protein